MWWTRGGDRGGLGSGGDGRRDYTCDCGFANAPFGGGDGDYFFHIADVALLGETALAAGELWGSS